MNDKPPLPADHVDHAGCRCVACCPFDEKHEPLAREIRRHTFWRPESGGATIAMTAREDATFTIEIWQPRGGEAIDRATLVWTKAVLSVGSLLQIRAAIDDLLQASEALPEERVVKA